MQALRRSASPARSLTSLLGVLALACLSGCQSDSSVEGEPAAVQSPPAATEGAAEPSESEPMSDTSLEEITLGAGCFWCVEAVLIQVDGVVEVESGYMGGEVLEPTYKQICTGNTGHAEVVRVRFDPQVLPVSDLLAWFWQLHDPTTLNRQGADVGTQYRSAIFYNSEAHREAAEASKTAAQADFVDTIVTEITPASTFWSGEEYHQEYYRNNSKQGYCRMVIAPKLKKLGLEY